MQKSGFLLGLLLLTAIVCLGFWFYQRPKNTFAPKLAVPKKQTQAPVDPLSIIALKQGRYPGSQIKIEEELPQGTNYHRYLVSYLSEGLKIYGYLTVPNQKEPTAGFPAIIFNHGYLDPKQYRSTVRYEAYMDGFARNGYVLFRPDYRGHGLSEGEPVGAYGSNAYTIDVLNAVASIKKLPQVNSKKIGMWGHSLGGFLTLRAMVVDKNIKAGVIWAGVVAPYPDLINNWHHGEFYPRLTPGLAGWVKQLISRYGPAENNNKFWQSISATSYLTDISGPLQLHHGTADSSVPVVFSQTLQHLMEQAHKPSQLYLYENDDHNLDQNFNLAMERSVSFFDRYLK